MFLVGPPGSTRRRIALLYCDAAQRHYEYVCLSRDTTEGDLKQRKELVAGAVQFVDSAPVRAARHGRILILDGVEKAVRTRCSLRPQLCITRSRGSPVQCDPIRVTVSGPACVGAHYYSYTCSLTAHPPTHTPLHTPPTLPPSLPPFLPPATTTQFRSATSSRR